MKSVKDATLVLLVLLLLTGTLAACTYRKSDVGVVIVPADSSANEEGLMRALSEAEFVAETQICQEYALEVELLPGKVVCSGDIDGEQVMIDIIPKVEDGVVFFYVSKYIANGEEQPEEAYDDFSIDLLAHPLAPEDFYPINLVSIVDGEMILTRGLEE